jgi:hypothetical protein
MKVERLVYTVLIVVLIIFVLYYFLGGRQVLQNSGSLITQPVGESVDTPAEVPSQLPSPSSPFGATSNLPNDPTLSSFPRDQLTAQDLLPKDQQSSLWAQSYPEGQGNLQDKNFLQSGFHVGINSVGNSLRNANLQLRSEPPNPQVLVSPWAQSTIAPDTNRRYFEVGSC